MSSAQRLWGFTLPIATAFILLALCLVLLVPAPTAVQAADPTYTDGLAFGNKEQTCSLAIGDFNNDGHLDVIAGNSDPEDFDCSYFDFDLGEAYPPATSYLYLNDHSGQISQTVALQTQGDVVQGDLDGNGTLDIVAGNAVWLNDGTAVFTTTNTSPFRPASHGQLALGDLNGDGQLDLAATAFPSPTQLFFNDGNGNFNFVQALPPAERIALGDLDGDGRLDIMRDDTIHYNTGGGDFMADTQFLPDIGFSTYLLLADVNGDNALDIIGGSFLGRVEVYFNDGRGNFPERNDVFGDAKSVTDLVAADLNGDGSLDLLTANAGEQKNHLFLNNGFSDRQCGRTEKPSLP
ncbi:MAG: VCBS repeat-containing protein [Anaerolineales bacterium]|nr:VCBS repeat-containing protein [Anaerolineales bacterium]